MGRFMALLGLALVGIALLPAASQAQVVYVQPRPYVVVTQPVVPSYYVAPSVTTYSSSASYSYYPSTTVYSAPGAPLVMPQSTVVTYSAPVTVMPAGVITTRTSYGYGIFRPRGYYTETYYTPLR